MTARSAFAGHIHCLWWSGHLFINPYRHVSSCCSFYCLSALSIKMRLHAQSIIFIFLISSSRSFHINSDYQRRGDLSDDMFMSEIDDEVPSLAISSENELALLADENSIFQDDFEPLTANPGGEIAQGSSCEQPSRKRDTSENDMILSNQSSFSSFNGTS